MKLFTGNTIKTYKTQDNAIKAARKVLGDKMDKQRWVMAVTSEDRYHLVFIGTDGFDLIHDGFCVAG